MLPNQQEIEIPLLETLVNLGGQGQPKEIYDLVRQQFPDTPDQAFDEMLSSGKINKWKNRVQWIRHKLIKRGEMESPARGIWRISTKGRERLQKLGQGASVINEEIHLKSSDLVKGDKLRRIARERRKTYKDEKIVPSESVPDFQSQGYVVVRTLKSRIRIAKPKSNDEQFEDEIWLLLDKLGFSILNGSRQFWVNRSKPSVKPRREQIDVFAKDNDDHVFIIECKYSDTKTSRSMKAAINNIGLHRSQLRNSVRRHFEDSRAKKLKVTFLIATRNIQWSQGGLDDAKNLGIHVWRDRDIDHLYELAKLYDLIGDAVRYQLYATMFSGQRIARLEDQKVAAIENPVKVKREKEIRSSGDFGGRQAGGAAPAYLAS